MAHKHHKAEDEQLEGPGQFLRHYSPDIDSFLFSGTVPDSLDLGTVVLLDFGSLFERLSGQVKHYRDLSPQGDYVEAIGRIYDDLRWAETMQDARCVLITNFKQIEGASKLSDEHRDALFDRIFRATSGKEL